MFMNFVLKPIQSIFLMTTWRHFSCPFNSSSSPQATFFPQFIASARRNIKECDMIYDLYFDKNKNKKWLLLLLLLKLISLMNKIK